MMSFCCLYCWLWTDFTYCSGVSIVDFEQVNASSVLAYFTQCLTLQYFKNVMKAIFDIPWKDQKKGVEGEGSGGGEVWTIFFKYSKVVRKELNLDFSSIKNNLRISGNEWFKAIHFLVLCTYFMSASTFNDISLKFKLFYVSLNPFSPIKIEKLNFRDSKMSINFKYK